MKNVLVVKSGSLEGNVYPIAGRTLIGRDAECDIQVLDSGVSRKHACVLEQDDGSVLLRDLASHNGTYVRGKRTTEALLSQGDELKIGDSLFEYRSVLGDADQTSEIDIKLVSGPAQASTATMPLSAVLCCDSPLALRALSERWRFCPACGGEVLGKK